MSTDQVGVLYANQPSHSEPTYSICRADARALKASGQGFFVNHGKDIRLLALQEPDEEKLVQELRARDRSAQMNGPSPKHPTKMCISEQYCDGHKGAVAIVEAWA